MHQPKRLTFWQHHALMMIVTVPVLALIRGAGSVVDIGNAPQYILHSAIVVGVSYPILSIGAYGSMRFLPKSIPMSIRAVIGCLLVAPILSFLNPMISWFIGVGPAHIITADNREELFTAIMDRQPLITMAFAGIGTFLWMGLNFSWWRGALEEGEASELRMRKSQSSAASAAFPGEPNQPHYLSKLPVARRGVLWALSSELHYVRVHTSRGNDLILMRLADAMEQSTPVEGLQIHRSHWVAFDGVKSVRVSGGKMAVILKNDKELPVSRTYQGAVRNALANLLE